MSLDDLTRTIVKDSLAFLPKRERDRGKWWKGMFSSFLDHVPSDVNKYLVESVNYEAHAEFMMAMSESGGIDVALQS